MPLLTFNSLVNLQCEKSGYLECYIAAWIWKVVPFTLVFFGVIGNVLSLITFSSRRLRKKSTCMYLIFLAFSDIVLLCSGPIEHTFKAVFGIDLRSSSSFSCLVTGWIIHTSGMTSSWAIVLITAERAFVTLFPVAAKPKMTPRNAFIISVSLTLILILINGHSVYGRVFLENQINLFENNGTTIQASRSCILRPGKYSEFFTGVWTKLRLVIGSILPSILIVIGNAVVAISLMKSRRSLRRVQENNGKAVGDRAKQLSKNNSNYKMFFILCGVFTVTTVPYVAYLAFFESRKDVNEHILAKHQLFSVILRCLYWTNFSINFILYCMTGSLFRKELKGIFESAHKTFSSFTARSSIHTMDGQER